jgi:hypothetical protein
LSNISWLVLYARLLCKDENRAAGCHWRHVGNSVGAQRFTVLDIWPIEVDCSCVRNSVGAQIFIVLDTWPIEVNCSCVSE